MALTILAAYDVEDNNRRARVAAVLQRWGTRLQKSVFICTIDHDGLGELVDAVSKLIDPRKDSFMVMRQCEQCWGGLIVLGQSEPAPRTYYWAVM